ncbi:MAG TPA: dockerin type I domain-containing protein [Longimicrobium sp.]|nr:dockerin type I domain-containing protein [Longimicrobium sp.]
MFPIRRILPALLLGTCALLPAALRAQEPEAEAVAPTRVVLRGDADGDGRVTRRDAVAVTHHTVGHVTLAGDALVAADADGDGRVTTRDALLIESHARGRDVSRYGVGHPVHEDDLNNGLIRFATAPAGSTLEIYSGDGRRGVEGDTLPGSLYVRLRDGGGNPVSGVKVAWTILTGGGGVRRDSTATGATGTSANRWILGAAGPQTLQAEVTGAGSVVFTATALEAGDLQIQVVQGGGLYGVAGDTLAIQQRVKVTTAGGDPVAAKVTWAADGGGAAGTATSTSAATDGVARNRWVLGATPGAQQLRAWVAGGDTAVFTATAVAVGDLELSITGGNNQAAAPLDSLRSRLTVRLEDGDGHGVAGLVRWTVLTGGGIVRDPTYFASTPGTVSTRWLLGAAEGAQTVQAAVTGGPSVTFNATAVSPAGLQIEVAYGDGLYGIAGDTVGQAQGVIVRSSGGTPTAGDVTWTAYDGSSVATAVTRSRATDGEARNRWVLGGTAGVQRLVARVASGDSVVFTATAVPRANLVFSIRAGDGQTATPGTVLPTPLTVRLDDGAGHQVSAIVRWSVQSGGGSLLRTDAYTTSAGASNRWTLGAEYGTQMVQVAVNGGGPDTLTFTALAELAEGDTLVFVDGDTVGAAGEPVEFPPSVRLQDGNGDPIEGYPVGFTVLTGGGTVSNGGGDFTAVAVLSGADGIATLTSWKLGTTPGANSVRASAGSLTVDFHARGTGGDADSIQVIDGDNQSAIVNTAVSTAPRVRVFDRFGNPTSAEVSFQVISGGGSVVGEATALTDEEGYASLEGDWTLGTVAGTNNNVLRASAHGASVDFTATAVPGPVDHFVVEAAGGGAIGAQTAGVPFGIRVTAEDEFDNTAEFTGTAEITSTGAVTAGDGTSPAFTAGVLDGHSITISNTGSFTITAATTGGETGTSAAFTVGAAAADSMAVSAGDGQSATAGSAVATAPAVLVTDGFGNPVSGVAVTFAVASGGGSVTGGSATTNASGIATVGSWTLGATAGANSLTASAAGLDDVTFTATGTPGAVHHFDVEAAGGGDIGGQTAGESFAIRLRAEDANGNTVTSFTGTADVTSTGTLSAGGGATAAFTAGVLSSHAVTVTSAGSATITATRTGGTETGTSNSFGVDPGAPASMTLSAGDGQSATVGTAVAIDPAVLVTDAYGNPIAEAEVTFTVATGGGSVTGASASTSAAGIATVGSWTLGATAGSNNNTLTASSPGVADVTFTASATAGAVDHFDVEAAGGGAIGGQTAGGSFGIRVTARDAAGNVVTTYADSVVISSTGTLSAGGGSAGGFSGGVLTHSVTVTSAGSHTVSATRLGGTETGTSGSFAVSSAAAAAMTASAGTGQSATAGTAVATDPAVLVTDAYGNPVAGVSVTFTVASGGGSVAGSPATTNASGIATVESWTLGTTAGTNNNTLTASAGGLADVTFTASATPGAVDHFTVEAAGGGAIGTQEAGKAFDVQVTAYDAHDNLATGFTGTVDVTSNLALGAGGGTTAAFTAGVLASHSVTFDAHGNGLLTATRTGGTEAGTSDTITVLPLADPADDTYAETVLGNVSVNSANAATPFSVTGNDTLDDDADVIFAGWNGATGVTENGGAVSVTASGTDRGKFTYDPPAGFEGTDRFRYKLTGGDSATVTLTVSGMIWFVDNNAATCTQVSAGCGRLSSPFSSLAAFDSANDGEGSDPGPGDDVFLYESATAYTGPVGLLADQKLIGQDAASSLSALTGLTPPASATALPAMNGANATKVTISGADGVNLGTNNGLYGFTLATTAGEAISGAGFGTLTHADVAIAAGGQALSLTTGTLASAFTSLSSGGGTNNVYLNAVATSVSLGTGALTGATGYAIEIVDGSGSPSYAGSVTASGTGSAHVKSTSAGACTTLNLSGAVATGGSSTGVFVDACASGGIKFTSAVKVTGVGGMTITSQGGAVSISVP